MRSRMVEKRAKRAGVLCFCYGWKEIEMEGQAAYIGRWMNLFLDFLCHQVT
jgi:hypothetical protein